MRVESHNGSINGDYDKKSMHETAPYARDDDDIERGYKNGYGNNGYGNEYGNGGVLQDKIRRSLSRSRGSPSRQLEVCGTYNVLIMCMLYTYVCLYVCTCMYVCINICLHMISAFRSQ